MSDLGDLATSGLLYEGNLNEWLDRMRCILRVVYPGGQIERGYFFFNLLGPGRKERSIEFANIMWWQVTPQLRSRINHWNGQTSESLMRVLARTARPFRFLDLPKVLRYIVYKMIIPRVTTSCATLPIEKRSHPLQHDFSVLGVSQQVRAEVLPLHGFHQSFSLKWRTYPSNYSQLRETNSRPVGKERVDAINEWASCLRPDSIRMLRRLSVQHLRDGAPGFGTLSFSIGTVRGKLVLGCAEHAWLKLSSQQLLEDHVATISNAIQSLGLEGEALILVLTSRPDIWDQMKTIYQ